MWKVLEALPTPQAAGDEAGPQMTGPFCPPSLSFAVALCRTMGCTEGVFLKSGEHPRCSLLTTESPVCSLRWWHLGAGDASLPPGAQAPG